MKSIAVVSILAAASASAQVVDYVPERSGNTWTLGDLYVGLIGFNQMPAGTTVTGADLLDDIAPSASAGRVVGIFNGLDNLNSAGQPVFASNIVFGSGDSNPLNIVDPFVSATNARDGRVVAAAFIVFEGDSNLTFRGTNGGTDTFAPNGSLGAFPYVIPAPGSAAVLGLAGLAAARRRR